MTLAPDAHSYSSAPTVVRPRRTIDVAVQQLAAIDRFHSARRQAEAAAESAAKSREDRLDVARRRDILRRQHEAMIAQSHQQLCLTSGALSLVAGPRVMLAHRSEWFAGKVGVLLHEEGVHVTATVSNGADAIGAAIAEQPDLVLVEDALEMVSGEQVIAQVRELCPDTVVTAQVPYNDDVAPMLRAGVAAVFTRKAPPADVARELLNLLGHKTRRTG